MNEHAAVEKVGNFTIPDWKCFELPGDKCSEAMGRRSLYALLAALYVIDDEGTLDLEFVELSLAKITGANHCRPGCKLHYLHYLNGLRKLGFIGQSKYYDCTFKLVTEEERAQNLKDYGIVSTTWGKLASDVDWRQG